MTMQAANRGTFLTIAALLAILAIGCSEEEDIVRPSGSNWQPPFPNHPDTLISNFKRAYTKKNLGWYQEVLNPNYIWKFQQHDIDELNLPSDHLTLTEELEIAQNMFSGDPIGYQPAISEISIDDLTPQTVWEESLHPDFPNSQVRLYDIDLKIYRHESGQGEPSIIEVRGPVQFYVSRRDSVQQNGSTRDFYQLLGQVDLTSYGKLDSDDCTWGSLKAMYCIK